MDGVDGGKEVCTPTNCSECASVRERKRETGEVSGKDEWEREVGDLNGRERDVREMCGSGRGERDEGGGMCFCGRMDTAAMKIYSLNHDNCRSTGASLSQRKWILRPHQSAQTPRIPL